MKFASATDYAILVAARAGTLRVTDQVSRFGSPFAAIQDDHGVIEVHEDREAAERRVQECTR
jgi:hypothetical protein